MQQNYDDQVALLLLLMMILLLLPKGNRENELHYDFCCCYGLKPGTGRWLAAGRGGAVGSVEDDDNGDDEEEERGGDDDGPLVGAGVRWRGRRGRGGRRQLGEGGGRAGGDGLAVGGGGGARLLLGRRGRLLALWRRGRGLACETSSQQKQTPHGLVQLSHRSNRAREKLKQK